MRASQKIWRIIVMDVIFMLFIRFAEVKAQRQLGQSIQTQPETSSENIRNRNDKEKESTHLRISEVRELVVWGHGLSWRWSRIFWRG
jgi:hypothetical protein